MWLKKGSSLFECEAAGPKEGRKERIARLPGAHELVSHEEEAHMARISVSLEVLDEGSKVLRRRGRHVDATKG